MIYKNKILTLIYNKCARYFDSRELQTLSFKAEDHVKIISKIESKLFKPNDLHTDGSSTFDMLVRRSLAQYLGYKYWNPSIVHVLMRNAISLFLLPFYTIFCLVLSVGKLSKNNDTSEILDAVLISDDLQHLHEELFKLVYPTKSAIVDGQGQRLTGRDIFFIINIILSCKKILLYPELLMRVIKRIAQYSFVINGIDFRIIVHISSESSPWSSILTAYCRMKNIKHIQIMHGIRFYSSQAAFTEFDEYYIWGEYHLEEYKKMHVKAKKFIIMGNPFHQKLYIDSMRSSLQNIKKNILICFDPIMILDDIFSLVEEVTQRFVELHGTAGFRPHPVFMKESLDYLKRLQNNISISIGMDNPHMVPLIESLSKADVVCTCYSNTLTDAWITGKKCIYIHNERMPILEFHRSKNIKIFHSGDDIKEFILSPIVNDNNEWILKNRFSFNFDSSIRSPLS